RPTASGPLSVRRIWSAIRKPLWPRKWPARYCAVYQSWVFFSFKIQSEMNRQSTAYERCFCTSTTQREVIQAHGQTGSQKKSRSGDVTSFVIGRIYRSAGRCAELVDLPLAPGARHRVSDTECPRTSPSFKGEAVLTSPSDDDGVMASDEVARKHFAKLWFFDRALCCGVRATWVKAAARWWVDR
ncbi:MAG: hypothetical protein ACJAXA_000533, partial [Candidatus Aldehydirespiratoraceae bacterium]